MMAMLLSRGVEGLGYDGVDDMILLLDLLNHVQGKGMEGDMASSSIWNGTCGSSKPENGNVGKGMNYSATVADDHDAQPGAHREGEEMSRQKSIAKAWDPPDRISDTVDIKKMIAKEKKEERITMDPTTMTPLSNGDA